MPGQLSIEQEGHNVSLIATTHVSSGIPHLDKKSTDGHAYTLSKPDHVRSPMTGMTRGHWMDAARFLLEGVFGHVDSLDSPIVLPKQNEVTYPQPDDPKWKFQSLEFEGLARTFMLAAPVITNAADTRANGMLLRDYYANQLIQATDPSSPRFLGRISKFTAKYGKQQYQHTVEGAALVIGLMASREQIWDRFNQSEKNQIAALISDYAHSRTIGHNWRFFNVLMLTFLKVQGYRIDEEALRDHMQHLLSNYVGDGWYVDDITYDFYNPWGFHFYGPIWCQWYGYEHEPEMAAIIESRNREFIETYIHFFSRDAQQLMWGRSIIYRCAASAAFGAHFTMRDPVIDPGHARRVASGNLMQFLGREDIYVNDLPCLGYYGPFEPLVQFYSCAASPFWLGKTFLALSLPQSNPFWSETETDGFWSTLVRRSESISLEGPAIQVTNHGSTGTTEIRTAKVPKHDSYYNQLQFNTHFCLEAITDEGANAANYSIREFGTDEPFRTPLDIAFNRVDDGILYRQMNTQPNGLGDPNKGGINKGPERIDLADVIIPGGVIRVDRVRIPYCNDLQLGHFALPHLDGRAAKIESGKVDEHQMITASINGRKVAIVAVHGWDKLAAVTHSGLNPEANDSTVVFAHRSRPHDYSGMEVQITVMLHRLDNGEWSDDELMPIAQWNIVAWAPSGNACGVYLRLKDGREVTIDHGNVDGRRII